MLKKNYLGKTGLEVTEFCLGVLPMGPLQAQIPEEKCVDLIRCALGHGVNFLDTAELYLTQQYVGLAVQGRRDDLVIATKSYVSDYDAMAVSVERSLREMDTSYIDIYHLHAAKASEELFQKRAGALRYLLKAKEEKIIRAVGVATHNPAVVKAAAKRDDIDVVFALLNKKGMGIHDGSVEDMVEAVEFASIKNKGVYAMKALAGGNLYRDPGAAFSWIREVRGINSVAVGVVSKEELYCDLEHFGVRGLTYDPDMLSQGKNLHIFPQLCQGCGACIDACPNEALSMVEGKAAVNLSRCLLCGYCGPECSQLAIRVI